MMLSKLKTFKRTIIGLERITNTVQSVNVALLTLWMMSAIFLSSTREAMSSVYDSAWSSNWVLCFVGLGAVGYVKQLSRIIKSVAQWSGYSSPKMVTQPPLMFLDRVLRFLWTAKTYERVFKPARADIVEEWKQAHLVGDTRRAWYIKNVLGRGIMLSHVAGQLPWSAIKLLARLLKFSS